MFGRLRVMLGIGLFLNWVATASLAQAVPINFVTNVDYNPHGQIIKVEYGNGAVTNYTYDPLNLRLKRIYTVNSGMQALQDLNYTYDSAGNILSITDAVNTATQTFQYDALNRLTQAVGALYGTKTFAYDQIGNILQKDGLNYAYGENGAGPHAVTSLSDGTTYQYDLNGNMIKKTKPTEVTDYTYDVENRLVNVKKNTTLVAEYFYDGDGGRVGKIDYTQTGQSGTCFLAGTQILMADGSARPIEKLVIGDEVIGFDEKLMKKVPVKVTQVFNQETAYDYLLINGHLKVTPNHKVYTAGVWKEIGQMKIGDKLLFADLGEHTIKSFEKIRSNEGVKVYNIEVEGVHNYFANGYLVHNKMVFGSQTTGKVTKYLGSLYENVDGQEVRYIFLGSTRVASINAGKIYYYHDDHLGGTNVLSNNLGAKTELMEYLPFGGYAKHEKYGSSAEVAYYYFTGKPLDDETGLYYFGARYYDPSLGRFITPDWIVPGSANPQALNRYSYSLNDPVNRVDPSGNWSFKKLWKKAWDNFVHAIRHPFDIKGQWNRLVDEANDNGPVTSAAVAFVFSGFNPIVAVSAAATSGFLESSPGRRLTNWVANEIYDDILGFSPRTAHMLAYIDLTMTGTYLSERAFANVLADPVQINGNLTDAQIEELRKNGQFVGDENVFGPSLKTKGAFEKNNVKGLMQDGKLVGSFQKRTLDVPGLRQLGAQHSSANALTVSASASKLNPWRYATWGVCHQATNVTLLNGGISSTILNLGPSWDMFVTTAVYGNYGGQLGSRVFTGVNAYRDEGKR